MSILESLLTAPPLTISKDALKEGVNVIKDVLVYDGYGNHMKLRHFAIVCNEIDKMEKFYKNFGFNNLSNNKSGKYINTLTGLNDVTF